LGIQNLIEFINLAQYIIQEIYLRTITLVDLL